MRRSSQHSLREILQQLQRRGSLRSFRQAERIFSAGDPADALYVVESGRVHLSVVSAAGKEVTIGIRGPGEFFGEACIASSQRQTTATAATPCVALAISKRQLQHLLDEVPEFNHSFVVQILHAHLKVEEELAHALIDTAEKRLVRVLLKLAELGGSQAAEVTLPRISQEALAEIVGTTRGRINFFMNDLRRRGLIDYRGQLKIWRDRLQSELHADEARGR
jgi:CRP/FNR family cyclic AMP-dependent transcriptional regulator